jgi:hypothetical protein
MNDHMPSFFKILRLLPALSMKIQSVYHSLQGTNNQGSWSHLPFHFFLLEAYSFLDLVISWFLSQATPVPVLGIGSCCSVVQTLLSPGLGMALLSSLNWTLNIPIAFIPESCFVCVHKYLFLFCGFIPTTRPPKVRNFVFSIYCCIPSV